MTSLRRRHRLYDIGAAGALVTALVLGGLVPSAQADGTESEPVETSIMTVDEAEGTAEPDDETAPDAVTELSPFSAPDPIPTRFIDVPEGHGFYREIDWMRSSGISTGWTTPAGAEYRPRAHLTREAAAVFFFRTAGETDYTPPTTSPFIDVPTTHVFYREIAWMWDSGLSRGWATPRGAEYRPGAVLLREAMAAFLYRRANPEGYRPSASSPFLDVPTSHTFYREIKWMADTGLTTGACTPRGREYLALDRLTREQMAAFLYRSEQGIQTSLRDCPIRFIDVPTGRGFAREIDWMLTSGISTGWLTAAGWEYRPRAHLTREAAAAFFFRAAGVTDYTPPARSPFVDVPTTHVFYREIAWMWDSGLSKGWATPRGAEYRPGAVLLREAMAAFLYRRANPEGYRPSASSPFLDVPTSHTFYREIKWMADTGLTTGACTPRGREYLALDRLTREQMAAFLYRSEHGSSAPLLSCPAPNLTSPGSITVVVNKKRPLSPIRWAPGDLVMPAGIPNVNGQPVRTEVARALERMHRAMRAEIGRGFNILSGFRSYETQERLFNSYAARDGVAAAERYSARPGHSEHQTGLAVDLDDGSGCGISECFGRTPVGRWLRDNAHRFGFILRYDSGQEHVVGYLYEPWHFRYVGTAVAQDMRSRGFVNLENYFRLPAAPRY